MGETVRIFLRFFGWIFSGLVIGAIMGMIGLAAIVHIYGQDLPDHATLASYEPATLSRVYSSEGALMDEFVSERRIFTPIDEIPDLVKHAFISAEDGEFYNHWGFDPIGIASAFRDYVQGGRLRGASTIPQQVVKNFLLSGEREIERKIKEIILAVKLEQTLSKDQILELYLNEIFLGQNAHGVTAAAQIYFGKTLEELTPGEAAYLAALPKAPSNRHPVRNRSTAVFWRNNTLREMAENGYIPWEVARAEQEAELATIQSGELEDTREVLPGRSYFTDEVRRQLTSRFGREQLFGGGFAIRATIDPDLQAVGAAALRNRLESWDRERGGWRGPVATLPEEALGDEASWRAALGDLDLPRDIPGWHPAVVLRVGENSAQVGIEDVAEDEDGHYLPIADAAWTGQRRPGDLWSVGDVVYVMAIEEDGAFARWSLRQIPEINGGFMAMDTRTGRVLALQGGFSYDASVFNRATQARRQPGSAFKPFVFAAALDRGFSPATIILDAPVVIDTGAGEPWAPRNSSGTFLGPRPMRVAIEQSRNLMTVRVAHDIGMDVIADYAERFDVYEDMPHHLSYSLGAGETTLYQMVAAYAMFANGGRRVEPTVVDRVQDGYGNTIYRHDRRNCLGCETAFDGQIEPWIRSHAQRVMNSVTAFQLVTMMQGVVQRGTATLLRDLGHPIAGKTGTTNDAKDAWFIGFTPNIVAGCFVGYDTPRPMGRGAFGGTLCAPVVNEFMRTALAEQQPVPFRQPSETVVIKLDALTGERLPDDATGENVIEEIFRLDELPTVWAASGDIIIGDASWGNLNDLDQLPEEVETSPSQGAGSVPSASTIRDDDLSGGGLY
ncbi:MAG: PBP1A family penicillin-binding protein [Pseudomonadota bacterium]